MRSNSNRWKAITESQFAWEREALDFVREGLPDREPYRAWANFEFVADDGSVNEVDLLVLAPTGFFLIEIKSQPGGLRGDAGTWTWRHDGRSFTVDNPLILANKKAKRLKSLLAKQRVVRTRKIRLPFLEAAVFLSATNLEVRLDDGGRHGVFGRDGAKTGDEPLPGILERLGSSHRRHPASRVQMDHARALEKAMDEAGIRPSQRLRKVGDYELRELLADEEGWQDWRATHAGLKSVERRVRVFLPGRAASAEERKRLERAAAREFRLLEGIAHPGILRVLDYKQYELGPALIFEYQPKAQRLDHFLRECGDKLSVDVRLHLLRSVAEAVDYAHQHRLYHRALSPDCVLVLEPARTLPPIQLFNWQTGTREARTTSTRGTYAVSGTVHVDDLVREAAAVYIAPEVRHTVDADGVAADLFSLGALAFHLFSGQAPAGSTLDLHRQLKAEGGLRLAAAVDGAPESLDQLVFEATRPEVSQRLTSAQDFLAGLNLVEEELTRPEIETVGDPDAARAGDHLDGGFAVSKRLGKGSTSIVFLVDDGGAERVLKLARDQDQNQYLRNEAEVLEKLRHHGIVEIHRSVELYGRVGIVMERAGDRTLAEAIRKEGRLGLEFLERFGDDLLSILVWLEEQGIPHRDLKPDNLGIRKTGKKDTLHLILFDFSLSRAPAEKLQLGTRPYLDPFLGERKTPRWDLSAERFAAAMTLHEMATGSLPVWGDGKSDPALIEDEVRLDPEAFPPAIREPLSRFFESALARDASARFDNAEEMRRAWRQALDAASTPLIPTVHEEEEAPIELATLESQIIELGLSPRAFHAVERLGLNTVRDLLATPLGQLNRMPGVGAKTRQELLDAVRRLRKRFPEPEPLTELVPEVADETASVDLLVARLLTSREASGDGARGRALRLFLGLDVDDALPPWPSQSDLARRLQITRARVHQFLGPARSRWAKAPALTGLRRELAQLLRAQGGVATLAELEAAVLNARGSDKEEPARSAAACAATRAALEAEATLQAPAFRFHRRDDRVLVALSPETDGAPGTERLASWALALGEAAERVASEDPLPSPGAVLETLQSIPTPEGMAPLPAPRLLRLAAGASRTAAVSGRLELYPRGMEAARALRLAAGSILGIARPEGPGLRLEVLRERVGSRYPEAAPLPDRPELDGLLAAERLDLTWDPATDSYRPPGLPGVLSSTGTLSRLTRTPRPAPEPETVAAAEFQERLQRSLERGGYLLVVTPPRHLSAAEERLTERFSGALQVLSLERLFLVALRQAAEDLGADWQVVLRADAAPADSRDGRKLKALVARALPAVEEGLLTREGALLLTFPGLLARWDQFDLLERLRDRLARPIDGGPKAVWVLAPGDEQSELPRIDGKAVPVVTPGEWVRLPASWLTGAHLAPQPDGRTETSSKEAAHGS